jgi:hypothetical protein
MKEWFENKTVSIVGNASSLFQKKFGTDIDSADIICRINRGIIIKNPECQGEKIDVWAYGTTNPIKDILKEFKSLNVKTLHLSPRNRTKKIRSEYHKKKIEITEPLTDHFVDVETINNLYKKFGYDRLSSGLLLLNYVYLQNPKLITLYGFDWKETPTWYFEEEKTVHKWDKEKEFISNNFLSKENIKIRN